MRCAARAGSTIRYVTVACTVTSWKSAVRAWNSSGNSRSSKGISDIPAVSGRNQNARPAPSLTSFPRRSARMCEVGSTRRCRTRG